MHRIVNNIGRNSIRFVEEWGYGFSLLLESFYWLFAGSRKNQPVRFSAIAQELMVIGVQAIPIVSILCLSVGIMLAIQGIENLRPFGAESQVVLGIALSVTREFAPLIVSILVAGRSGSAIAARIGTMQESQEVDALYVIGINPVRYLVAPVLIAMLVAVPCLTILGNLMGLLGGGLYASYEMNISMSVYAERTLDILSVDDIRQGLIKSFIFALIIALVGTSNGFQAKGGALAVGRSTTRSVVMSISLIVLADMIFTYFLNR